MEFSPDFFCIFGLVTFFLLPYTVCLGVFVLKRHPTLLLKPPAIFLIGVMLRTIFTEPPYVSNINKDGGQRCVYV